MASPFTKEQLQDAREVSLFEFMLRNHANLVKRTGSTSIDYHPEKGHHIVMTAGRQGGFDNLYGKHIGNIDFLMEYLGYTLPEAVIALTEDRVYRNASNESRGITAKVNRDYAAKVELPEAADNNKRVFAYLNKTRCIPTEIIKFAIETGRLYQDVNGNCVFVNKEGTFFEQRGTLTDKPFHRNHGQGNANYWSLQVGENPKTIYICEASIDALSLAAIHKNLGVHEPAVYVAIGGVNNHQTIDRLVEENGSNMIVLAVDNDHGAGDKCREKYPNLRVLLAVNKDWNEDLIKGNYKYCAERYVEAFRMDEDALCQGKRK